MIHFKTADSVYELEGIVDLQKHNLRDNLSQEEIQSGGFVTVTHTLDQLVKLNDIEKHIIAMDNDIVIGYLLAMTKKSQSEIPALVPMFIAFNETVFNSKRIAEYNYIVVGQVCIASAYRGQGVLQKMYAAYKARYRPRFDFAITEIDASNPRSIQAHKKIGFREIVSYRPPGTTEWSIVIWNWEMQ